MPEEKKPAQDAGEAAPRPDGDHRALAEASPDDVSGYAVLEDGVPVTEVRADGIFSAARWARDHGYRILSLLSAYDDGKTEFGVLYAFVKPANTPGDFAEMRLKVRMPRKDEAGNDLEPECQSIVDVFSAADWQEREMYDLYGIVFHGHPALRRIFMPEGWSGFPHRKDYREPEQFIAMRDGEDIVLKTQEDGSW